MASGSQMSGGSSKSGGPASGKGAPTPKQLAAQARAESEAAERRRERMVRIVGGIAVFVVVVGLLAVGFLAGRDNGNGTAAEPLPTPDASAPLPKDAQPKTFGWQYGTGWTSANEAKLPTLELWEDFQCPGCKALEDAVGPEIAKLGSSGIVKLLYRPATFLDGSSGLQIPNSSARATAAWGCAIDAGKGLEYHSTIFANQPTEGDGYSDETLVGFATTAGITGDALTTFTTCFDNGTYLPWAANSQQQFSQNNVGGTPTGYLNGVELKSSDLANIAGLKQKIAAATAK
jgi:protein-disulfide isomerase